MIFTSKMVQRWFHLQDIICPYCMATPARVPLFILSKVSTIPDGSAVASHQHVRQSAGLFDVGHMVQSK